MGNTGKIIIVDDESMVTKTLQTLLKIEGFSNVECFNNPLEALAYLKNNPIELIVSDFIMPELNGIEFLMKAKELQKEATQILLTGYADKENAIKAINELGIFKYIEKPWNNEDLIINIKNAIERTRLKKALKLKITELEEANSKLEKYSKNLEAIVKERTFELQVANRKLGAVIENCADGIVVFDEDFKIISVNPAVESLFGVGFFEIKNKNFFELVINEKNQKFDDLIEEKNRFFLRNFSLVNYKKDLKIPVEISVAPFKQGEDTLFIAVIRDVSYQIENERLRDDFIATLTHDLRTPLLAGISGLEFVLNETLGKISDKQKDLFAAMKKSNEDMLGLVSALLEVYRYEAGKIYLCKTRFSIGELINECIKELEMLAKQNCTKIEFKNDKKEEILINADRNEIRRVISNLIGNAIKHGGENSKIKIKISAENRDIEISVEDNGVGLNKEDCEKLFKRFSQGTSKKRSCSTGLGLYLSRQIIEAHGGKIWVESEPDKGSKFSFILKNVISESRVLL